VTLLDKFVQFIRIGAVLVTLVLWTPLGLICWVPLMIRTIALFTSMVMVSSFSRNVDMEAAQQKLSFAIEFYIWGFQKILEVARQQKAGNIQLRNAIQTSFVQELKVLIANLIYTILFWSGIIVLLF